MAWLIGLVVGFFKKLIFPAIVIGVLFLSYNAYQKKRVDKTFTATFSNVNGLSRGAPVYALGVIVGKVVNISPMVNSNLVGVKIMITKKDFPIPGSGTRINVIQDIEKGGAKVVELLDIKMSPEGTLKSQEPGLDDYAFRISMEALEMTKNFADSSMKFLGSPKLAEYKDGVETSINDLATKIEHGTLKDDLQEDLKSQMSKLNDMTAKIERGEDFLEEKDKAALDNQLEATKKTLDTLLDVSDVYKKSESPLK